MMYIIILVLIHWALFHYVFEFQRITLKLSRIHLGKGNMEYQSILTPKGMKTLRNILRFGVIFVSIVVGYNFGWLWGMGYYILTGLVSIFSWVGVLFPFPRDPYCLDLIEKHLNFRIGKGDQMSAILDAVQKTRLENKIDEEI